MANKCEHHNFRVDAKIGRITKGEGGPVEWFCADIRIKCTDCDIPFEFVGVKAGLSPREPLASVDAQELRAPIQPKGLKLLPAVPGYTVRAN